MTVIIKKIKGESKYAICRFVGASLKPLVVSGDFDFLVSFCKHEGYTWYFNKSEETAISINT